MVPSSSSSTSKHSRETCRNLALSHTHTLKLSTEFGIVQLTLRNGGVGRATDARRIYDNYFRF
jgi:hypothetical protein